MFNTPFYIGAENMTMFSREQEKKQFELACSVHPGSAGRYKTNCLQDDHEILQ